MADSTPPLDTRALERIRDTRIFFGHRSVGTGIVTEGIPAVYATFGLAPPQPRAQSTGAGFFDDVVLEDGAGPVDKIQDFASRIRGGIGSTVDIAFMKLGYLNIDASTDVHQTFEAYRAILAALASEYPDVRFLHVTITPIQWDPDRGANMEAFNELLRGYYASRGDLLDLSKVLSTCPDGHSDIEHTESGAPYRLLCDDYTVDGGHLSALGNEVAATAMLRSLSALTE